MAHNLEHPKPFPFRSLPSELRLRVLEHTHLGPPSMGDYDARFEQFLIRDGRLVSGVFDFATRKSSTQCCSPSPRPGCRPRATVAPRCRCRKLPLALFLVDRQMYREAAIEVFYAHAWFNFFQDDLRLTLSFLRDTVPREVLGRIRCINFTMTEAQCEGWNPRGALSCGYPDPALQRIAKRRFDEDVRELDYQADWRAVLAFLKTHADLPKLRITVDIGECSWTFAEETLLMDNTAPMLRFIYDFAIDITTALCSLKTLDALRLEMSAFDQLAPWLEREVLGRGDVPQTTRRLRPYQKIPNWHRMDQRLVGSNYREDQ